MTAVVGVPFGQDAAALPAEDKLLSELQHHRAGRTKYESQRWKNVNLKIIGGTEELVCPMMQASTIAEVRQMLADSVGADPGKIDLFEKKGCQNKRLRNCDHVPSNVLVKGITNFGRRAMEYPFPWVIVGAGAIGLRMALHWTKLGKDYVLFERKAKVGGNAWNGIANTWSKLQSEGGHYQLDHDCIDGVDNLRPFNKFSFWPTRDEIIAHFHEVLTEYNMWPNMIMGTQVQDLDILHEARGRPESEKVYRVKTIHVGTTFNRIQDFTDGAHDMFAGQQTNDFDASCLAFFPGALAGPHRKTFPGEEHFGGQVGYGFNDEFNYAKTKQQQGIVIGMGAFAVENVRTLMEHCAGKFFVIARHHNILLPRMISWYVNQSRVPPPAATILRAMEPMYALYGKDPWSFFSIQTNTDRTVASIKQYTRWGIGDVYFLGVAYGKVETVEGQVKRLKRRTAVLTTGRVLTDLDHVIKCLGFDSDFGTDRINKTRRHLGFWPDADYRRWIASDQSAIDASRFGGTALAPYAESQSYWGTHFFDYPQDARTLLDSNVFIENWPKPEVGSAAYHYEPRAAAVVQMSYGSSVPALKDFGAASDVFKKSSMWATAPPERFLEECEKDWYHYCRNFREFGDDRPYPAYPYTLDWIFGLLLAEQEDSIDLGLRAKAFTKEDAQQLKTEARATLGARLKAAKERRREREAKQFVAPQLSDTNFGFTSGGPLALQDEQIVDQELVEPLLEDRKWWEHDVQQLDPEQTATFKDRHPEGAAMATSPESTALHEVGQTFSGIQNSQQIASGRIAHTGACFLPARAVLRMRAGHTGVSKALSDEWLKNAERIKSELMRNSQFF